MLDQSRSRYQALIFRSSQGGEEFLIRGVTTAFLNPLGTEPLTYEHLTNLIIDGRRISIFLQGKLATEFEHDFVGESMISLWVSS